MGEICGLRRPQRSTGGLYANDRNGISNTEICESVNKIRASVAMAVCNGEDFIKEQIDSILLMLGEQDELIISYDSSTDRTWDIIKTYENTDKRIKVFKDTGKSVESNFNNAVKNCHGTYIFLADQDDVWINNKIDRFIRDFEKILMSSLSSATVISRTLILRNKSRYSQGII